MEINILDNLPFVANYIKSAWTINSSETIIRRIFNLPITFLNTSAELISQPIDKIKQIKGVSFDWNEKSNNTGHDIGVIAQDIEKVLPEIVATRDNGYKAVRYEKIVALLIEAVKDQQSQIDELKAKL